MAFPKHHGITLATGSWIENLVFEPRASDPVPLTAGRAWYNTTDKKFKFVTTDTEGAAVLNVFTTQAAADAAVADLQTQLNAEIAARQAADTTEATARATADTTLQANIDAEATARATAVTNEATARAAADTALQSEIDAIEASVGLDSNGGYQQPSGTNYLDGTTSIADATIALDTAINSVGADALAESATKVSKDGDTMTGNLVMQAGTNITLTDLPSSGLHAVNQNYVDARLNGLKWKQNVELASTGNVDLSQTFAAPDMDDVVVPDGARLLLKDQTDPTENGIYTFTSGVGYVRAADADEPSELSGSAVLVRLGTLNTNTSWTCPLDSTAVVGTDPIVFVQHNGASSVVPGVGLSKTGNQIDVNLGAGISQLPSDEVGVDVHATGGLFLTEDGSTASTNGNAQLAVKLDGTTLATSVSGVKVAAQGITATELHGDVAGAGLTGGNGIALTVNVGTGILISGDQVVLDTDVVDAAVATETTRAQAAEAAIQSELDATQAAAGLDANGSYTPPVGSNYLGSATTLKGADAALDAQLKTTTDATATNASNLSAEITRATNAEGTLTSNLNAEITRAQGAESTLTTNLNAEISRAQGAEASLQSQIDTLNSEAGAGAEALKTTLNGRIYTFKASVAQLSYEITHNLNTEYYSVQVMVEGADSIYRNDIVPVEEKSSDPLNTLVITLSESRKIKVVVENKSPIA